jgi:hypothetical protein
VIAQGSHAMNVRMTARLHPYRSTSAQERANKRRPMRNLRRPPLLVELSLTLPKLADVHAWHMRQQRIRVSRHLIESQLSIVMLLRELRRLEKRQECREDGSNSCEYSGPCVAPILDDRDPGNSRQRDRRDTEQVVDETPEPALPRVLTRACACVITSRLKQLLDTRPLLCVRQGRPPLAAYREHDERTPLDQRQQDQVHRAFFEKGPSGHPGKSRRVKVFSGVLAGVVEW